MTYDSDTGLGWLDTTVTDRVTYNEMMDELENNPLLANYRMATFAEYDDMLSRMIPSIYTATSFYGGNLGAPIVDTSEASAFRQYFGNSSKQVIFGNISDGVTHRYVGSNSWNAGQVAYSEIYITPGGIALDPDSTFANSADQVHGWHLVSTGTVDLESGEFFSAADVNAPDMALGGLALFGLVLRRRKSRKGNDSEI